MGTYSSYYLSRRVTRGAGGQGGEGGGRGKRWGRGDQVSPALFQKLEKSALILRKNALIVASVGYRTPPVAASGIILMKHF